MGTVRYMYNGGGEYTYIHVRKGEKFADKVYEWLYDEVWTLLNNKDLFLRDSETGIVYSKEYAQYVYHVKGDIGSNNDDSVDVFWKELLLNFKKGRLNKYCYVEKVQVDDDYKYYHLRITPYIVIRCRSFPVIVLEHNIHSPIIGKITFTERQVMGIAYCSNERVDHVSSRLGNLASRGQVPVSLWWKIYDRDLSHEPLKIKRYFDSNGYTITYVISFNKKRHKDIVLHGHGWGFDKRTHLFFKYIETIDKYMRMAFNGECSLQVPAHKIKDALNGTLCDEYAAINLEEFMENTHWRHLEVSDGS